MQEVDNQQIRRHQSAAEQRSEEEEKRETAAPFKISPGQHVSRHGGQEQSKHGAD
ncbi:hypothetical protein D3C81_2297920 [compost metagenome]